MVSRDRLPALRWGRRGLEQQWLVTCRTGPFLRLVWEWHPLDIAAPR
ncbi:hypothetical protein [Aquabacter spiritensis]|nr:hypothetical protein [Aquabacter spiritensis]